MGFDLRYPNITAQDEKGQLLQMRSYLHQLVEQLQWALNDLNTASSGSVVAATRNGQASAPTNVDAESTFNAVKSLIIKSADIVSAYSEKIQARLDGIYVAESDFGTFKEQTSQSILSNSSYAERSFSNIQEITNNLSDSIQATKNEVEGKIGDISGLIDGISRTIIEVSANIRSGLLYVDNGVPVYGLEVGQKTKIDGVEVFDKFARFTSDRLSFYDQNDNEVAYISDRKLYINHVEIKGSLRMGGFIKTVLADGSIVKRWITGGEG